MGLRRIARHMGVPYQSVAYWVKEQAETLPRAPVPEEVKTAEFDELFTFIGDKKKHTHRIYIITLVDRDIRCILGWKVTWERTATIVQAIIDESPKANRYFSDAFDVYPVVVPLWTVFRFGRQDQYVFCGRG
jgi:transposase InsO family protein